MNRLFLIIITAVAAISACAQRPVRFNNEKTDTTAITGILIKLDNIDKSTPQRLVAEAARMLVGKPYQAGTLEQEPEMTTVNIDAFDCTTFVETCLAMALTVESRRSSWHDFVYNLERIRYRGGNADGYPSRLHYISDWIVDNSHRGILQEVTDRIGHADYTVKTLDFMSGHRDAYKALKDSANFAGIKNVEVGYRSHRFPIIKPQNLKSADIREGDIIAIATTTKGLDVTHIGIAVILDGVPHLIHASSKAGKVIEDPVSLQKYLRKNRQASGIRVIRIKD